MVRFGFNFSLNGFGFNGLRAHKLFGLVFVFIEMVRLGLVWFEGKETKLNWALCSNSRLIAFSLGFFSTRFLNYYETWAQGTFLPWHTLHCITSEKTLLCFLSSSSFPLFIICLSKFMVHVLTPISLIVIFISSSLQLLCPPQMYLSLSTWPQLASGCLFLSILYN